MDTKIIYEAIYNMLIQANTQTPKSYYEKLKNCNSKIKNQILENIYLADKNKRPLCQDTGQVVVFIKIGQNIHLKGEFLEDIINKAVKDCYKDNFYRKSVVVDAVYNRTNTKTNTPCIIHTKLQKKDEISILIGIKGGGAENMTKLKMMNPTSSFEDIMKFAKETVIEAKDSACPPMTVGIGVGGTAEVACLNAKYALFEGKSVDLEHENVIDTKIITSPTHIACLPVCVNLNCHSLRHSKCTIKNGKITYHFKKSKPKLPEDKIIARKVKVEDLKNVKNGENILLSGKIYTARDMAHKKITEIIKNNEKMPFEIKNSVIFYAGPCPKNQNEIIGPIGPTTSKRMDKFAPLLYEMGAIATIGKGERNIKGNYLYLHATGGVANVYQKCVKSAKLIAFEDLGAEAVYELEVYDMPLVAEIL